VFATAVIVFREVLEAALIVGIVMAATRGAPKRSLWVGAGLLAGLLGASLVAGFADAIAMAAAGMGQEWFNAVVLFVAVGMLAWHNIWMKQHGRDLSQHMNAVGRDVHAGHRPMYAVAVVVGVAVLREGSEVVLFLYGIAVSGSNSALSMLTGGIVGMLLGAAVGALLYFGLLRIPMRHLFAVTSWLILLLSAGMAAQGAGYLVQAGVLPALGQSVWNTSAILSQHSLFGQLLHTLIGYMDRPEGIQIVFYVLTVVLVGGLMQWMGRQHSARARMAVVGGIVVALGTIGTFLAVPAAHAEYVVYSPRVEYRELELESNGYLKMDPDPAKNNASQSRLEVGYGFTPNWFSSMVVEGEQAPGGSFAHSATAWENILQLTEPGKYWLDAGLYLEYEEPAQPGNPQEVEAKALLEKTVGRMVNTANLVFNKQLGTGASGDTAVSLAWRSKYLLRPGFEPGVEIYSDLGTTSSIETASGEQQIGPVISGRFADSPRGHFRYELGYLIGVSPSSPVTTIKGVLEYEAYP
jgi:high-affinity iron transporter